MKSTGMIRNFDGLGRIVIPKELRDTFNIKEKSPIGGHHTCPST